MFQKTGKTTEKQPKINLKTTKITPNKPLTNP